MSKVFEDYFSELQADMVSICVEYAFEKADKIYIYCSYENRTYYFNFFYNVNDQITYKHKLNTLANGNSYDVSISRQKGAVDIGMEDLEKIHALCQQYERDMPTEMKLIYEVKTKKFEANYRYDPVYANMDNLIPMDIFNQWFEEITRQS